MFSSCYVLVYTREGVDKWRCMKMALRSLVSQGLVAEPSQRRELPEGNGNSLTDRLIVFRHKPSHNEENCLRAMETRGYERRSEGHD